MKTRHVHKNQLIFTTKQPPGQQVHIINYRSGTGRRCCIGGGQMLCVYSLGGSTFLWEVTSWQPSQNYEIRNPTLSRTAYLLEEQLSDLKWWKLRIFARDSIYAIVRIYYRPTVCLSVRPSHGPWRVDQSKTVEVGIMQLSPLSSPMTLVSSQLTLPRNSRGT